MVDLNDMLGKAAKPKSKKKSKSKTPDVSIPTLVAPIIPDRAQKLQEELENLSDKMSPELTKSVKIEGIAEKGVIGQWKDAHADLKDAKARMAQAEAQIIPEAEKKRLEECAKGEFQSSVAIDGMVVVSTKNQYSPISTEFEEDLQETFGDRYDEFFVKKSEVKVAAKALEDPEFVGKLVETFGSDVFGEYFEVTQKIAPTDAFHQQRSVNDEVREKAQEVMDQGIVKPYKPALKPA